jgi:ribosomal protein S18 acetylase RimI-like enzyme
MMTGIAIRRARIGDARAVARVHVDSWRTTYAGIIPDRAIVGMSVDDKAASWRQIIAGQARRDAVLVASASGAGIVGYASVGPAQSLANRFEGEIYTLYVLTDWQNRGIGRALLRGSFAFLAGAGMASAFAWVLADNPARFFYQAVGGKRVSERDERLWGALLHQIAYGWADLGAWLAAQDAT